MNRKTIIIWAIVIAVAILGIIVTYFVLGNNGSSSSSLNNSINNPITNDIANNIPTEAEIESIGAGQGTGDYSDWSIMPVNLQSRLVDPRSGLVDYFYAKELGIAFSYETKSLNPSEEYLITSTLGEDRSNARIIYLHDYKNNRESGQSIEIIDIEDNLKFSPVQEIISLQILDELQRKNCKIEQKDYKYLIVPRENVKDASETCGKYTNLNNKFFIKPNESGTYTTKLVFVNAGDREISYDGSMQGQYWYQSIVVE